ncbi:MAG: hypothetical protein ABI763_13440 [Bacteroidota bacterium]
MKDQIDTQNRCSVSFRCLLLFIFLLINAYVHAANYSWTGSTSNDWGTGTNWTPAGIPGTSDNVTLPINMPICILDSNRSISQLTISDSLNLGTKTLTVTGTSTFNSVTYVNNGNLTIYASTSTITFSGGIVAATLNVTASSIMFSGTAFTGTVNAVKKGTSSSTGNGGSKFSSTLTAIDSSTGNWTFANSSPDTCLDKVVLKETSSGSIYFANGANGNDFSKSVSLAISSSGNIFCTQNGSSVFHDTIIVSAASTGFIKFGTGNGITTLDTSIISVGSSGFNISSGNYKGLYLRGIHQDDSTRSINLTLTGVAELRLEDGSLFKGTFTANAPVLRLNETKFMGTTNLTHSINTIGFSSQGGCYFGGNTIITKSGSGTLLLGGTSADTLASGKSALIQNPNAGAFTVDQGIFKGKVIFANQAAGSDKFVINSCTFSDSVTLNNTTGGMRLGPQNSGTAVLDSSARLYIPSSYVGTLKFQNLIQYGTSAINVPFQSNLSAVKFDTACIFNGPVTANVQTFELNGSTFNNSFYLKKTALVNDQSKGGNVFNGTCEIVDSNSHIPPKTTLLAVLYPDHYNGNTTFKQYGVCTLSPAYSKNSSFAGNVTVESNSSSINFSANGGKIIFDGSGVQTFNKTGSYNPIVKNVDINKSAGYLKLFVPLAIDTLKLLKGIVITDSTNIISIPNNGKVIASNGVNGGSDSGYVHGPLKKRGDDMFTFPCGDTSLHANAYHPFDFNSLTDTNSTFTVSYFPAYSGFPDNAPYDSVIISTCEYWKVKHDVGTTSPTYPELGGNTNICPVGDIDKTVVVGYNGSTWQNYGHSGGGYNGVSHPIISGVSSLTIAAGSTYYLTFGIYSTPNVVLITPDTIGIGSPVTVHKWEKYEIGFELPQEYIAAIDNYLDHRILAQDTVDHNHDLNPYADDSLLMVLHLTSPSGRQIIKYGFFMRSSQWIYDSYTSDYNLDSCETVDLSSYKVRFRFAPDEDSTLQWNYNLFIAAPFTKKAGTSIPLMSVYYSGSFVCDGPLSDNHGYLSVNNANKRFLVFDDGTTFFGIGENLPDLTHFYDYDPVAAPNHFSYIKFYHFDFSEWKTAFQELHSAGGNLAGMFMLHSTFAPEYEYLGWYDEYHSSPPFCPDSSSGYYEGNKEGNRQWNLWAFDQIVEEARNDDIYLQLNLDYHNPFVGYQRHIWGGNCYVRKYVYPTGTPHGNYWFGPYAHPEFYWTGPSDSTDPGALYFWKRKYKYIFARWGYSVNIGMYQVNSEIDQQLGWRDATLSVNSGICDQNDTIYHEDLGVLAALTTHLDTVIGYIKNGLGDSHHLFTLSYTPLKFGNYINWSGSNYQYHIHFQNPNIDVTDIHFYSGNNSPSISNAEKNVQLARYEIEEDIHGSDTTYQLDLDKPFHFGEGTDLTKRDSVDNPGGGKRTEPINKLYDNYDVSFHNEIWATSFMNTCTSIMTWVGPLVHWWQNGLPHAPSDTVNIFQARAFSNELDSTNDLSAFSADSLREIDIPVKNKKIYHNYKMLSDYFVSIRPTTCDH